MIKFQITVLDLGIKGVEQCANCANNQKNLSSPVVQEEKLYKD
jgi:hypothetical protein